MAARRPFRLRLLLAGLLAAVTAAPALADDDAARAAARLDLELRAATFELSQQRYFSALEGLELARAAGTDGAATKLGLAGTYLSLGLPADSDRLLRELGAQRAEVPARAWLNLARLLYQRGHLPEAEHALSNLSELPPGAVQIERDYLLSLVLLSRKRYREAIAVSKSLQGEDELSLIGRYNHGLALLHANRVQEGLATLEALALTKAPGETAEAVREHANVLLGYYLLNHQNFESGRAALARTTDSTGRLGAGWLESQSGKHDIAVQRWQPLVTGDARDIQVQEALVALPRALYQLKQHAEAAAAYERALDRYAQQAGRLDAALAAAEDGSLLAALIAAGDAAAEPNWYRDHSALPPQPAAYYVQATLESHVFQEGFKQYRDLLFLRDRLQADADDIAALTSLLDAQQRLHGQRLREILERSDRLLESPLFTQARDYRDELARIERDGDSTALATTKQNQQLHRLHRIEQRLPTIRDYFIDHQRLEDKHRLLRGLLLNDLVSQYPQRLWDTKKAMKELEQALADATAARDRFRRAVAQAKTQLVGDRAGTLHLLRERQRQLLARTEALIDEQRGYLVALLGREVRERRDRLAHYTAQAQIGVAQAYDQLLNGAGPTRDYAQALEAYRRVLAGSGDRPQQRDTLIRMATLEIKRAEQRDAERVAADARGARASEADIREHYRKAIALLEQALARDPSKVDNDRVLYLLAKAHDRSGEPEATLAALDRLVQEYPASPLGDEAQFRRGELLFTLGLPQQAAEAYGTVVTRGATSPYYEKALYMHGWSLYRAALPAPALESFLTLLDRKLRAPQPARGGVQPEAPVLSAGDEEMVSDVLRVTSLSLAQLNGVESIERYFARHGARPYEHRLYDALARLYLDQERIEDAARVYRAYVARYPNDEHAPQFQARILAAYGQGGFADRLIASKEEFVQRYQPASDYWQRNPALERGPLLEQVRGYIQELARYYHARAQQHQQFADHRAAQRWYRLFLDAYPTDPQASEMRFLLAESLYESSQYHDAVFEYERVAYGETANRYQAEAAYGAVLAYEIQQSGLSGEALAAAERRTVAALRRYAAAFPQEARASAALAKAAQGLFGLGELGEAEAVARELVDRQPPAGADERLSAWRIIAHSEFESGRYSDAEQSYQQALALRPPQPGRRELQERLAAAIYRQGEAAVAAGDRRTAVHHFLRVGEVVPTSGVRVNADYDAAANLLALEDWQRAIEVLEAFRRRYPGNPLQQDLPAKLALAYQQSGAWRQAAAELEILAAEHGDEALRREALWQAAELQQRADRPREAIRIWQTYSERYPRPFTDAVEAQQRIAALYGELGDRTAQREALARLIAAEQQGGAARSERSRSLAANAALALAADRYTAFVAIKLSHPLDKSLQAKKRAMEDSLAAYESAASYGLAEIATAATYHSAEIYAQFSKDLLASERPKNLSPLELEQYDVLLEEQAYPFEEQAIALYQANTRRAAEQIYDEWVKKSYAALSRLMPARYAKTEQAEAYFDELY